LMRTWFAIGSALWVLGCGGGLTDAEADAGRPANSDDAPSTDERRANGDDGPSTDTSSVTQAPACGAGLDPSFGQQGVYTIAGGSPLARAGFVQSDGRVVVVGDGAYSPTNGSPAVFAATRLLTAGAPDPSYGMKGTAAADVSPGANGGVNGGALQRDGKAIVVGFATPSPGALQWLVARFNSDGSLDSSFGSGGVAPAPMPGAEPVTAAVAEDGSIFVAGQGGPLGPVVVAKYGAQGQLDTAFGTGGFATTSVGTGEDGTFALLLQPDGGIVVGGLAHMPVHDARLDATGGSMTTQLGAMLVRYTANGALDPTFGANGVVTSDRFGAASGLALQGDGKLVAAVTAASSGDVGTNSTQLLAARYTTAGTLDPTFAQGGVATVDVAAADAAATNAQAAGVTLLADGSIVISGSGTGNAFTLAKLGSQGALDTTFGDQGLIRTVLFNSGGLSYTADLTPDRRLVVAAMGYTYDGARTRLVSLVARYCL
jgi:uncharacterized delta-60 repeat protein